MTDQIKNATVNKLSVQYGLLIGVIIVVLNIVFYIMDPVLQYSNYWVGILSFVILITLLVVLGLDVRKKIGGYWSFGEAFKGLIIMAVLVVLISTVYNFVLFKFVNPGLPTKVNSILLDKTTDMLNKFGADQSKIDDATKKFQNGEFEASLQPTLKNELKGFGIGLLIYAVIDLIIAACIKKKAPLFTAPTYEEPAV
jgi:hypothetical protein